MSATSPVPPATPSERYLANIMERVEAVKQKLAEEGVEEQDIPRYMPGVLATNLGAPLPYQHSACNNEAGPMLPKGLMAKEVFNQRSLQHIKECSDANKSCSDILFELKLAELKKPVILNDPKLNSIKGKLNQALHVAGTYSARKTKFYLDYTPCDAEAFYAKITPLLNEYETLAEQLRDVRRNLV